MILEVLILKTISLMGNYLIILIAEKDYSDLPYISALILQKWSSKIKWTQARLKRESIWFIMQYNYNFYFIIKNLLPIKSPIW